MSRCNESECTGSCVGMVFGPSSTSIDSGFGRSLEGLRGLFAQALGAVQPWGDDKYYLEWCAGKGRVEVLKALVDPENATEFSEYIAAGGLAVDLPLAVQWTGFLLHLVTQKRFSEFFRVTTARSAVVKKNKFLNEIIAIGIYKDGFTVDHIRGLIASLGFTANQALFDKVAPQATCDQLKALKESDSTIKVGAKLLKEGIRRADFDIVE